MKRRHSRQIKTMSDRDGSSWELNGRILYGLGSQPGARYDAARPCTTSKCLTLTLPTPIPPDNPLLYSQPSLPSAAYYPPHAIGCPSKCYSLLLVVRHHYVHPAIGHLLLLYYFATRQTLFSTHRRPFIVHVLLSAFCCLLFMFVWHQAPDTILYQILIALRYRLFTIRIQLWYFAASPFYYSLNAIFHRPIMHSAVMASDSYPF
ncbi:hypothetical protein EDB89DRAFT_1275749 [Lactarius sanguifluus]|nr:hypothetical protein EDB89DRAFT_1275749 [Lactarius sanguifluus]